MANDWNEQELNEARDAYVKAQEARDLTANNLAWMRLISTIDYGDVEYRREQEDLYRQQWQAAEDAWETYWTLYRALYPVPLTDEGTSGKVGA